ncbi:MAG: hypothetical protein IKK92_02985, partial [Prevotella sp.]|nr:hypothetical protein [Prevotella sp.]
ATIVNGGTLIIPNIYNGGQNSAIGASSAAVGNLQLNGGKLVLSKDNMATDHIILITDTATISISQKKSSLSLKRQVMGSGYLIKDGPGQLNLSFGGSNTFAGLIVKEGIVAQGAWNTTFGREGGPMVLCGGEVNLMDMNNMSARPKLNHRITVAEGTSSIIRGTTRGSIEGSFHGTGNVTIYSTGVRSDIGADFSQFRGTLHAEGSNFRLMDNVTDMSQTYLVMGDGCNVSHYNSNGSTQRAITTSIGSLAASSSAKTATLGHSQDSYEIGGLDEDMTFYGLLKAKHINKVGNGKLSLRSAGHTSSISVNGGILEFNGINTTAMTSGLITVNNGGTLSGKGYVSDVIVNRGGTLAAGIMATVPGVMRMKSLKLNQGANIRCVLSGTGSNSRFNVVENIEHNGDTLTIVVPANRKLSEGEELTIFPTGFTSATGNVIIKCDSEADINYKFDTSTLNTDGKIRVTSVVSNIQPTYSSNALVNVYSIDGKILFLQEPLQNAINKLGKGIYIISDGNKRTKITK